MKFFVKLLGVPNQTPNRPDYEAIASLEREFNIDEDGFDERYDQMLLNHFLKSNEPSNQIPYVAQKEKLGDLMDSMFSAKYRLFVTEMIRECRDSEWAKRNMGDPSISYNALRRRMVERGKRRHD